MALEENLRSVPQIDLECISPVGFDQLGFIHALAKTGSRHPIAQALNEAAWMDVDQFGHEIGIDRAGSGVQLQTNRPSDFDIGIQWRSDVHQHVVAPLDRSVIVRPADLAGGWLGQERHRAGGIVAVVVGRFNIW